MKDRPKILIVDDKKENLFSLQQILKNLDADIIQAGNGNDALIASLNHDFALAILDVQMPVMDGYELAELLRSEEKTKALPMVFVSAVYSSDYHVFKGYDAGAVDFMVKPYNSKVLLSKVKVFVELEQKRKQLSEVGKKLLQVNETLELRVEERTSDLVRAIETLQAEIEKRKETEKELYKAQKEWQEIFEAIGHMTMIVDADHNIIAANRATIEQTKMSKEELLGKKCNNIFHHDSFAPSNCPVEKMSAAEEIQVTESEINALGRNYIVSCTPVFDVEGKLEKIIHIATDITKRKQLQRELIQAHKMEAIGSLAGGIAHDFNNILSAVLGFTDLSLQNVIQGSELEQDLKQVYAAGIRARDLIRQILNFARKSDEELKPVRVDLVIKEVIKFLRSTIPVTIEIKNHVYSDSLVLANPVKIHQLMMNLCTNAAHAMQDKGTLEITLKDVTLEGRDLSIYSKLKPGRFQRLRIRDSGAGIPADLIEKIFEPFFTTKGIQEGTGMGLAMVHSIVKECHGDISVESEPGKGSLFTVYLPITEEQEESQDATNEQLPCGNERILLVDDEVPICKLVGRMLESSGYRVTTVNDSRTALELFSREPDSFDLILTDMTMPHLSGDQLAKKMMNVRPDIPVILVTGFNKQLTPIKIAEIGIRTVLPKPFEKKNLLRMVRKILDAPGGEEAVDNDEK